MPTGHYQRPSVEQRLWAKVDKRGPDECWPWQGSKNRTGYGQIFRDGRLVPAHRVAWEITVGRKMKPGSDACHRCDNPPCCNPAHIFEGSRADNVRDCIEKDRFSRPPHGACEQHPRAKLTRAAVLDIRKNCRPGRPNLGPAAFGRKYAVTAAAIHRVLSGKSWGTV